jgi:hypothetical protein
MMRVGQRLFGALALAWIAVTAATGGCSSGNKGSGFIGPGSSSGGPDGTDSGDNSSSGFSSSGFSSSGLNLGDANSSGGAAPTCANGTTGWKCKVDTSCSTTSPTTLTGKVYDPAAANPLYNVVVFIPNDVSQLPAITPGTHSCNACDTPIGDYVTIALTDGTGSFTLKGVPTGMGVPVTVQVGKWRRTTTVNIPNSCAGNAVSAGTLHLPASKSQGDMPQMAVLTGGCDDLGCFMTGMGIAASEFTAPQGGGRVDVYQGTGLAGLGGAATLSGGTAGNCSGTACPLWASKKSFEYYDMALFSCECGENNQTKPAAGMQALHDWLNEGGKVFASHYQYTWFKNSPATDFQGVANWLMSGAANPANATEDIDATFPKGMAFSQWLGVVNALNGAGPPPTIVLNDVATSVSTVVNTPPQATLRWIYDPSASDDVKYMSFETPIGGAAPPPEAGAESGPQYCGKAVFTDLHTSGSLFSTVTDIPAGCGSNAGKLSAQQKALEFLFFDLSACVMPDTIIPTPPPPTPQ